MLANHQEIGIALAALAATLGCNDVVGDVVKDTSDLTLPVIVLEIRGEDGQHRPATEVTLRSAFTAGHALELMCVVSDPGGVSKVTLAFEGDAEACPGAGGPSAPPVYLTGLPEPTSVVADDDDGGSATAPDRLVLTASLPSGIGCYGYAGDARVPGAPRGARAQVRCTGENWSVNPATRRAQRVLSVELRP